MNTVKFDKKSTLAIAHRGLSGIERENTAAAFIAAANRSYYGIETDIHRTADGHFVICHDDNLERVAGVNVSVEGSTLSSLSDIILYDYDGKKSRGDLRLCTLDCYISICKRYEKHAVLELKSSFTDDEIQKIIEIIKCIDYLDCVTFISFDYENLKKARKISQNQSVQYLFTELNEEIIERLVNDKIDVDVHFCALNEEWVKRLHALGLKINCWTVDSKESAEALSSWGVDFITSNILE